MSDDVVVETLRRSRSLLLEAVQMAVDQSPDLTPERVSEIAYRLGMACVKAVAVMEYQRRKDKFEGRTRP